ncbi:MAG: ferredoxin:thioredoxin reductase [Planctomycetes bacterium]|nr:ferredoxin:thioredoxin reductase [Planctomycetota bacterium]
MKQEDPTRSVRARLEKYLAGKPFRFNVDAALLGDLLLGLAKKKARHGEEYCPCRMLTGNKEEDAKIICPCIHHLKELEANGHCKCFLFTRD